MNFRKIMDVKDREKYDTGARNGREYIFEVRKNLCDSLFIEYFTDQDFVDKHDLLLPAVGSIRSVWCGSTT